MHEIEQNDSTHPSYINYSPYAPPRRAQVCKKRLIYRFKNLIQGLMWELEVWHMSVVAYFKIKCFFFSSLKYFEWLKIAWEKCISLCCWFYFIVCIFVTLPGRSSLKLQSLNNKWLHLSPSLIIPANMEQVQQAASKIKFIIISMSCLYSSTGPHPPLWCSLQTVIL